MSDDYIDGQFLSEDGWGVMLPNILFGAGVVAAIAGLLLWIF